MELRERVARRICCARAQCEGCTGHGEGGCFDAALWMPEADASIAAVLDAMQEPNTATLQAGADRLFGAANDDWTVDAKEVWQAMLAAFRTEALPPDSRGGK